MMHSFKCLVASAFDELCSLLDLKECSPEHDCHVRVELSYKMFGSEKTLAPFLFKIDCKDWL